MRRTGICLVVTICALLASCGGGEDLPAMRNLGSTTTTLPSRGAGLFGTSAFSEVLDIIDGGEPAVALHGTNQPELLGEAVSRGCIRVADQVIELLINLALPLGTPVEILA